MIQFDRHAMNGSKFVSGSHSKPPTNFLSRNKRAIRDKSRSQAALKDVPAAVDKSNGRPRSKKAFERERKREGRSAATTATGSNGESNVKQPAPDASGTVTISKSYLDELLRMSIMGESSKRSDEVTRGVPKRDASVGRRDHMSHVNVEPTNIPGLDLTSAKHSISPPPPPVAQRTEHAQNVSSVAPPQVNSQGLSPRDKWLRDLAAQVEEQKAKKMRSREIERQSTVEEYFPFGRPGCGAPIRTQSGQLLTDYRSRTDQSSKTGGGHFETRYSDQTNKPEGGHFETRYSDQANKPEGGRFERSQDYFPEKTSYNQKTVGSHVAANDTHATYSSGSYHSGVSGNVMTSPRHHEQQQAELHSTTPRFARGAGPHVDQYMMKEMNEKRRKQMENMEFVRQQVAEKERAKMEERLRREREDAIEEAKLAAERQRLKSDFEREKEKSRRKELEAQQRQALLQQSILEAEESARQAKRGARAGSIGAHPIVSFDEDCIRRSYGGDLINEGVYSSLSKSELRSPSMLQLVNTSYDGGCHGDINAPSMQRGGANPVRKSRPVRINNDEGVRKRGDWRVDRDEVKRKTSKIPVIQQSPMKRAANNVKSKTVVASKFETRASKKELNERNSRILNKRMREDDRPAVKMAAVGSGLVIERNVSPPIPVVAKKLREQQGVTVRDDLASTFIKSTRNDEYIVPFVRSDSPPVPVVAKMLRKRVVSDDHVTEVVCPSYKRAPSPPVPAVARKLRDVGCGQGGETNEMQLPISNERTSSPPVPSVAKRLRNHIETVRSHSKPDSDYRNNERGPSPPVPAVVKRLHNEKIEQISERQTVGSKSAPVAASGKKTKNVPMDAVHISDIVSDSEDKVQLTINRPPSCDPNSQPLSPIAVTTSLPAIAMVTSNHHHDNTQPMVPLQSSNRQRLILQQLTMLKEGILTQQNCIDHRVQNILTRNKQCHF